MSLRSPASSNGLVMGEGVYVDPEPDGRNRDLKVPTGKMSHEEARRRGGSLRHRLHVSEQHPEADSAPHPREKRATGDPIGLGPHWAAPLDRFAKAEELATDLMSDEKLWSVLLKLSAMCSTAQLSTAAAPALTSASA